MAFNIKFDYRYDTTGFFTEDRKAIVEQAGDIWSSYIQDNFDSTPAGEVFRFPIDGVEQKVTLEEPIDDVIIFVASVELNSDEPTLGEGSYYGDFSIGSERQERLEGDDFEPWLGTIQINVSAEDNFYFDVDPATSEDIPHDKQDFLSLILHEVGHILGIGITPAFEAQIEDGHFTGSNSVKINLGEPIPLDEDHNHIEDGFSLESDTDALLDKRFTYGEQNLPTNLDLALLADIGYEIIGYDAVPVHRFFQFEKGFHFYTADENERKYVFEQSIDGALNYNYETVAYRVLASDKDSLTGEKLEGTVPVYRFFNTDTGAHLYTIDENEKKAVEENLSNYSFDGISYYAFAEQPDYMETIPLYRLYNNQSGSHLFTTDENEFDYITNNSDLDFNVEGNQGVTYFVVDNL